MNWKTLRATASMILGAAFWIFLMGLMIHGAVWIFMQGWRLVP